MQKITQVLLGLIWSYGGLGLLILGVLDSSFLFAPLGNDLLVVALTARHREILPMLYYSAMSSVGSVIGCLLVDLVFRKAGEEGLEKHLPRRRLDYIKRKVGQNAAWALSFGSIAPPPFPFTPVVAAASALQYPRKKMLTIIGIARMVRFTALGVLALFFGKRILKIAESRWVQDALLGLVFLFVVGSVISVIGWIKRSRKAGGGGGGGQRGRQNYSPTPEPSTRYH